MPQAIIPTPIPAWLPKDAQSRLAGTRCTIKRLPESLRRRLRTPKKIKVSEHAEKYRIVTEQPHAGPWRHSLAPHGVKIMDTYSLPHVREIWFCGPEQAVKTNSMLNCMHWAVDNDPGDIYYLMPTETTADKIVSGKIIPMLKASKALRKYVSKKERDTTMGLIRLNNGVTIRPAHANSASSMASFTAKHCFGDEVDKYPSHTGKESDPITLIKKRNRQYRGRYKRFFASTPAEGYIWDGVLACEQIWEYRHRCPHCEQLFKPEHESIVLPEGVVSPTDITPEMEIFYSCTECGGQLSEVDRMRILADPNWFCLKGAETLRPSRVGFHMRGFDCLDIPLTEIAQAWLAAENGGVTEKKSLANGYEAVDYVHEQKDRQEEFILRLVDEHLPRRVVPEDTYGLIIQADTQQRGFFYQVWAVGYGDDLPVAMIDHGYVKTFLNLKDIQKREYKTAQGKGYKALAGFIDSGGGTNPDRPKHSRTKEVYDFCRTNKFWRPLKGRRTMELPWNVTKLDYYPSSVGRKVPIPGGLHLYKINVTYYKDELDSKLQIERGDPGAIRFHAETDEFFAKQLCAEYRDERGYWLCPPKKDNHHWDIKVYGLALCDIIGIKNKRKKKKKPQAVTSSKGGGFVNNY